MTSTLVPKFNYPSFRRLEIMLGRIDAIAAFAELSVRELTSKINGPSVAADLQSLAARHQLNLTHVDLALLPLRTTQLHVVSVHQVFTEVLGDFKRIEKILKGERVRRKTLGKIMKGI